MYLENVTGHFTTPPPINEPILGYLPGSPEKKELKAKLAEFAGNEIEIPLIIGGKEVRTGNMGTCVMPHNHKHVLAKYHKAGPEEVQMAIIAARQARNAWAALSWEDRMSVFLKAADLLSTSYRQILNAATMLNQSKNVLQAEIDSACELIDFWRFNPYYAQQIYAQQPDNPTKGIWNIVDYRPLEGFVFAVTPFNFTSIAGNLPSAPAMMGNVALWKPASTSVLSGYYLMQLFKAAGLPDGVINFIPGSGGEVGDPVLNSPELAGIHFTGSTPTFQYMWRKVGENIANYKSYPRIVGETGGKDFIFMHNSACPKIVATAITRGAFEYQGQKCSAASRAYIPKSAWEQVKKYVKEDVANIKVGDVTEFNTFMGAVIDKPAFTTITNAIEKAKASKDADVVIGGEYNDEVGYFIKPTVIQAYDPKFYTMATELFGPVITVYVYDDDKFDETLRLCDETSPYALTGAIFATDRYAVKKASSILRNAAGNFYINDKPTGAVVGQQPFGGARASGTNDKAGSYLNLIRWLSPRTIKENFNPPSEFPYPHQTEA